MRRAPWIVGLAPVLAAGLLTACDGAAADEGLVPDLCAAIEAPDRTTAGEIFEGDVHQPLHDLAAEVQAVDREVTAALLEAKSAVETVVREDVDAPDALVRDRLEVLADRVRDALTALDRPAPTC